MEDLGLTQLAEGVQGPRTQRLLGNLAFVVQLTAITGENAYITVNNGKIIVGNGQHIQPTATLDGTFEALTKVVRGDVDITHCLSWGTLKVTGDYYDAIDFSRLALAVSQSRPK
ncbi:SCP2 sterol-binding domain-containing protein [Dehalococcoidia bacterium]|nr:SCP2 sterol-binding domain-containing protein [Dehalococcoidia bacterium]